MQKITIPRRHCARRHHVGYSLWRNMKLRWMNWPLDNYTWIKDSIFFIKFQQWTRYGLPCCHWVRSEIPHKTFKKINICWFFHFDLGYINVQLSFSSSVILMILLPFIVLKHAPFNALLTIFIKWTMSMMQEKSLC